MSLDQAPDVSFLEDLRRFLLFHKFGMEEVVTKLSILRDEFANLHDENPIEHLSSRLKSPEGLRDKMMRKGLPVDGSATWEEVQERVCDVAGVRVVCSFVSDVVRVFELLAKHVDIEVVEVRDYISEPKPNGYRSLHAIVRVPVFLSDGSMPIPVEVQFRTIAMDFWASLEHKIYYKYQRDVPDDLLAGLREAADNAASLDTKMERLRQEIRGLEDLPAEVVAGLRRGSGPDPGFVESLRRLDR
ncbi:GTP pyrophosphokinase [Nocardioides sp. GXZ039]|uniref:GTP pyrophosphokinase n=1 Tax=Nocardioides sp. GXZ039 TaxID=3136018 RepID=UPI0030F49489